MGTWMKSLHLCVVGFVLIDFSISSYQKNRKTTKLYFAKVTENTRSYDHMKHHKETRSYEEEEV